jgi:hypothetical protein
MKNADMEYQKLIISIKNEVTGRYVYSIDANPITYVVREYRPGSKIRIKFLTIALANEIILRRLFDPNGIQLDDKYR